MGAGIIDDDRGLKYLGESLIATSRYSYNTRDLRLDCEIWSRVDDIKEIEDYLHYASFLFRPEKGVLFENPIWGGIEYVFDLFPVIYSVRATTRKIEALNSSISAVSSHSDFRVLA